MTETGLPRRSDITAAVPGPRQPGATDGSPAAGPQCDEYGRPITSGWANWVVFAGVLLVVLACFHSSRTMPASAPA